MTLPGQWWSSAVVLFALLALPANLRAQEKYSKVYLDSAHQLHVVTSRGRRITPRKIGDQTEFDAPRISADRKSVGWLAVHPNCCTTYPIPIELVVLSGGKQHVFRGADLATWHWAFSPDGKRVVLEQGPVHGTRRSFELRDIRTGRRVNSFQADSVDEKRLPAWTRVLTLPPSE
ncbi:MAG TPA: hypothetical protein VH277_10470 [Gemmatimonadaceae bacterium]|jgi:hypothetical protein|nr:hypothetical protein [Gemmatimonadaceae bacterium]